MEREKENYGKFVVKAMTWASGQSTSEFGLGLDCLDIFDALMSLHLVRLCGFRT